VQVEKVLGLLEYEVIAPWREDFEQRQAQEVQEVQEVLVLMD
jgi:hypothetical protein